MRLAREGELLRKTKQKINKKQSSISSNDKLQSCHYPNQIMDYGGQIEVESSIKL